MKTSRHQHGYTILEILFTVMITMIGFVGLVGLQTNEIATVRSNLDTIVGLNCAQHFIEILREESLTWTGNKPLNTTDWAYLKNFPSPKTAGQSSAWLVAGPSGSDKRLAYICGGSTFNPVAPSVMPAGNKKYCLHYRFTWLIVDYLMRVDVRVMWPNKRTADWNSTALKTCSVAAARLDTGHVEFVTLSNTIMQNTNVSLE